MPARIHLSDGASIEVEDSAHGIHETLDEASRQRGVSAYLAEIRRRNGDDVVLVNPDHVVYVEDIRDAGFMHGFTPEELRSEPNS